MRPYATSVCGLKLLVYEALRCYHAELLGDDGVRLEALDELGV